MSPTKSLRPARIEPEDARPAYMPRIPWRWIGLGALLLSVVAGGYWLKERRKADALRDQILQVHEQQLADARTRYTELRDRLEKWAAEASRKAPDDYVDPRLQIAKLGSGQGLYLRLPYSVAGNAEALRKAATTMEADAIPRCLGLAPASARGLFERGAFLDPAWIEEARTTYNVRRLEVIDDELARRIQRDLPGVMGLLRSDWFMLVLQHERDRAAGPVDVFLWDTHSGQSLLRARVAARGVLIPARYQAEGAPPAPRVERRQHSSGADDCSIASQVKALAGDAIPTLSAVHPPAEKPSAPDANPAP